MTGKELQALRKEYGVSQTQLAEYLGYTVKGKPNRSMIARFENDFAAINPRVSMLIKTYFDNHDRETE